MAEVHEGCEIEQVAHPSSPVEPLNFSHRAFNGDPRLRVRSLKIERSTIGELMVVSELRRSNI